MDTGTEEQTGKTYWLIDKKTDSTHTQVTEMAQDSPYSCSYLL